MNATALPFPASSIPQPKLPQQSRSGMSASAQNALKQPMNAATPPAFSGAPAANAAQSAARALEVQMLRQQAEHLKAGISKSAHPPRYGKLENNAREVVRIGLMIVLPTAMSFLSRGGLPGFLMFLAMLPVVKLAGTVGQRIGKHVHPEHLMGGLKVFHRLHNILETGLSPAQKKLFEEKISLAQTPQDRERIRQEFLGRDHTGRINKILSEFIATSKAPKMLNWINNEQSRAKVLSLMKIRQDSKFGKLLNIGINGHLMFQYQLFHELARTKSFEDAMKSGAKGTWTRLIDFHVMPAVGNTIANLSKSGACPDFAKPFLRFIGHEIFRHWYNWKSSGSLWSILLSSWRTLNGAGSSLTVSPFESMAALRPVISPASSTLA